VSDGRGYALKFVSQTADEIISETQRKYDVIIGRLQAYDSLIRDHKQLSESVESMQEKLEELPEDLARHGGAVSVILTTIFKDIRELQDSIKRVESTAAAPIEDLRKSDKELDEKTSSIIKWLISLQSDCNKNEILINDLFDESNQIKEKHSKLDLSISESNNKLHKHERVHEHLESKIAASEDRVRTLLDQFQNKFSSLLGLEERIKEFQKDIESKILRLNVNVRDDVQKLSLSLEMRHKENLEGLESNKADCKKLITDNFIDIKNSQIKFDNINKQLTLLEKKIENINLLLKKYELDK
jgi:chromosome segregation ATPase